MKKTNKFVLIILSLVATSVLAHSGKRDGDGGHTNRKTGEYHCHTTSCFNAQNKEKTTNQAVTTTQHNTTQHNTTQSKSTKINIKVGDFATHTTYNRKDWKHWIDKDLDCQDERAEVLIEQSLIPVKFATNKKCRVVSGKWVGLYTKNTYTKASDLDIDHVVPLKEAHLSGGDSWGKVKKMVYANDRDNLIAVDKRQNRQKGFKDPFKWMPSSTDGHCRYIIKWTIVKSKYDLMMDNDEKNVVQKVLNKCNLTHQSN